MIIKIVHFEPTDVGQTSFTFELDSASDVVTASKVIKDFKDGLWNKEEPKPAQ